VESCCRSQGIELVKYGIKLTSDKSIEHVFIRQSVRRAFWGAAILALGFVFCSRPGAWKRSLERPSIVLVAPNPADLGALAEISPEV